ncbi:MAG TPA: hypothetical protein PLC99_15605 [Verrucomicrobiota bacterium]|nr:hypothetical protein [Verrucomicrobiota bacterium]
MIATLWVVAGQHCRLELLTGFEFLSCCQHADAAQSPAHHENECAGDGCGAVESGFYIHVRLQPVQAKPLFALVTWLLPLPEDYRANASISVVSTSPSPPELVRLWHVSQRAARPPRAPSLVS